MHFEVIDCPVTLTSENRDELRLLYADLRDHYLRRDAANGTRTTLHFVWRIVPDLDPSHFWATYADQRHTFAPSQPIMNSAQPGSGHHELLRHGFNQVIPIA